MNSKINNSVNECWVLTIYDRKNIHKDTVECTLRDEFHMRLILKQYVRISNAYVCVCEAVNGKIQKRIVQMIHRMFEFFFYFVMKLANIDNKSSTPVNFCNFYQLFYWKPVKCTNYTNRILWILKKKLSEKIRSYCIIFTKIKIDKEMVNTRLHQYMQ